MVLEMLQKYNAAVGGSEKLRTRNSSQPESNLALGSDSGISGDSIQRKLQLLGYGRMI